MRSFAVQFKMNCALLITVGPLEKKAIVKYKILSLCLFKTLN